MSRTQPTKAQVLEQALGAMGRETAQLREQLGEMGRVLLQILLQEPNNMLDIDLTIQPPDNFRGISYIPSADGTRAIVVMQLDVEAEPVDDIDWQDPTAGDLEDAMANEGGSNWVQLDPESAGDE